MHNCIYPSEEALVPRRKSQVASGSARLATLVLMLASIAAWAQKSAPKEPATGTNPASSASAGEDYSGMYTFLREGEFVEVDVEPDGRVTGFISRYGERDSDRGAFLDHMFSKGSLAGNKLAFTTRAVHGVSFEFKGTVERGEGKSPGTEAYYVIKGTLTEMNEDPNHKTTAQQREVVFKSFPAEATAPRKEKD